MIWPTRSGYTRSRTPTARPIRAEKIDTPLPGALFAVVRVHVARRSALRAGVVKTDRMIKNDHFQSRNLLLENALELVLVA